MSRAKSSTVLVLLACTAIATGCTRNDPTAPSEPPRPAFEHQGANSRMLGTQPLRDSDMFPTRRFNVQNHLVAE